MLAVIVLGQDGAGLPRPAGHGFPAQLAADKGKAGHGHREPAGVRGAHRTRSCHPTGGGRPGSAGLVLRPWLRAQDSRLGLAELLGGERPE